MEVSTIQQLREPQQHPVATTCRHRPTRVEAVDQKHPWPWELEGDMGGKSSTDLLSWTQFTLCFLLFMDAMWWYCSRGSGRTRSRKTSRTEALFDEAERFSRRTISVCLSNQGEDDQELPSVIEDTTLAPGEWVCTVPVLLRIQRVF